MCTNVGSTFTWWWIFPKNDRNHSSKSPPINCECCKKNLLERLLKKIVATMRDEGVYSWGMERIHCWDTVFVYILVPSSLYTLLPPCSGYNENQSDVENTPVEYEIFHGDSITALLVSESLLSSLTSWSFQLAPQGQSSYPLTPTPHITPEQFLQYLVWMDPGGGDTEI